MNGFYETKDKRDLFLIDLRKDVVNEIISKNRARIKTNTLNVDSPISKKDNTNLREYDTSTSEDIYTKLLSLKNSLEKAINNPTDEQNEVLYEQVKKIRILVSADDKKVPAHEFMEVGLLTIFSGLISQDLEERILSEALHALTNIMIQPFSELESFLENTNFIDSIVRLAHSEKLEIFDSAIWALGNIFQETGGQALRENLIEFGLVNHVLYMYDKLAKKEFPVNDKTTIGHISTIIWFTSCLTQGPNFIDVKYMDNLNDICKLHQSYINSEQICADVHESLKGIESYLQADNHKLIDIFVQEKRLEYILSTDPKFLNNIIEIAQIRLNQNEYDMILVTILDILYSISYCNDDGLLEMVYKTNLFMLLSKIFENNTINLMRKSVLILNNLSASKDGIHIAVHDELMQNVYRKSLTLGIVERCDILLIVTNIINCIAMGDLHKWLSDKNNSIKIFNHQIVFKVILNGLDLKNKSFIIYECLKALNNILWLGKTVGYGNDIDNPNSNIWLHHQLSYEVIGDLENQVKHDNEDIILASKQILYEFFNVDSDVDYSL